MGLLDSLVTEALGEKGAKAYIPLGLFSISLGSLLYDSAYIRFWADSILVAALTLAIGLAVVVASDINLAKSFLGSLDFEKLGKEWEKSMTSIHEILSGDRSVAGDVMSSQEKGALVQRFLPLVVFRLGGFYLTSLSFLFAINDISTLGANNFLLSLGSSRFGFAVFFLVLACAAGLVISPIGEDADTGSGSSLPGLGKQVLGSYFLGNARNALPSTSWLYRAVVPLVAIQMVTKGEPLHTFSGLYQYDRVTEILEAEVKTGDLVPLQDSLNLLQSVRDKGSYQPNRESAQVLELQELSEVEPDSFIAALLSGKNTKEGVNCRFRPKTKNGLFAVAALRGCVSRFREIRLETNKIFIREDIIPKTIFFVLGVGDKSTMMDFELKFALKAKKQIESELVPCERR